MFEHLLATHPLAVGSVLVLFGLCWGSFANVCIHRLPRGMTVVTRPSHCGWCLSTIPWYQNVPLLGWFFLGGRCPRCRRSFSPRHLLVELLGAVLLLTCVARFGFTLELLAVYPFVLGLTVVSFIDLDYQLIPDELSLGGLVLGLMLALVLPERAFLPAFLGAAAGGGALYALAWIYERATGGMGLGGGDIKLMAAIGAFLGPRPVFVVLFLGSMLGLAYGIVPILLGRAGLRSRLPFGPFLCLAALACLLLEKQLLALLAFALTLPEL